MSSNYRNKQWFKNLSEEQKKDICDKFLIDEKTLRHAGRAGDNGSIYIDLLRIDKINHIPEIWNTTYDKLNNKEISTSEETIENKLEVLKTVYSSVLDNVKYLKYKDNLANNLRIEQAYKNLIYWFDTFKKSDELEHSKYCTYQMFVHCKCLLESDIKIAKALN